MILDVVYAEKGEYWCCLILRMLLQEHMDVDLYCAATGANVFLLDIAYSSVGAYGCRLILYKLQQEKMGVA